MNAPSKPDVLSGPISSEAPESLRLEYAHSAFGGAGVFERASLWIRVHIYAFRSDPVGYLTAVGWRIRGLRVRSRHRIAALAGKSPLAYRYWVACKEPRFAEDFAPSSAACDHATIVPLIDCRGGARGLEQTLASLPEGLRPVIVGAHSRPGAVSVGDPAEVARLNNGSGVWLCVLRPGDRLAEGALTAYERAATEANATRVIYADDDLIQPAGRRTNPHFKPAWNPDLFEWHDFLTGACIVSALPEELTDLPHVGWAEALVRRIIRAGVQPLHLPYVLHHRSSRPEPLLPTAVAIEPLADAPLVTVIIPTRNRVELLRKCVQGVDQALYPRLEVIVVDNGSDQAASLAYLDTLHSQGRMVIRAAGPFNYSALNNLAVAHARGELLCFLNNDVEMLDHEWLALLSRHALRSDIGAVGARLLYPDLTIQHAGVFTGIGGGAGHAHRYERHDARGYFDRSRLPQRVSAVTAACLVVSKNKFMAVGGFDEDFPVAFNDVDLCLKLNERGWQSFYEPRATLLHHESKSRGSDRLKRNRARFAGELALLKRKWATDQRRDPFHHPQLSPFTEQFLISV